MLHKLSIGICLTLLILSLGACSKKTDFALSAVVPAARGFVTVKTDKNENYVIKVSITDLAEPDRLQPPHQTYVVWLVTELNLTKNIGQLKSSTGSVNKQLKASFKAVSPYNPVKVFVTAENDPVTQYPSDLVVLSTEEF